MMLNKLPIIIIKDCDLKPKAWFKFRIKIPLVK